MRRNISIECDSRNCSPYLFDKVSAVREQLEKLQFEVLGLANATTEGRRRADHDGLGLELLGHIIVERLNGRVDLGVPVGRLDERGAFALEHGLGAVVRRVDQRDDLETRSELVLESERVVPWTLVGAKHDVAGADHGDVKVIAGGRRRVAGHGGERTGGGSDAAGMVERKAGMARSASEAACEVEDGGWVHGGHS